MVHKLRQLGQRLHIYDLYMAFAFLASLSLWLGFYYKNDLFLLHSFVESLFLVGNYYFFLGHYHRTEEYKLLKTYPLYFLFQTICCVALTFKYQNMGGLYLGLVPCVCGTFFFMYRDEKGIDKSERKGLFLYLMGACAFLAFSAIKDMTFISYSEGILFFVFSFWVMGLVYLSNEYVLQNQRSLVGVLLKKKTGNVASVSNDKKDKLFFHDLINHTHGLSLFLNSKISSGKETSTDENLLLLGELRMMQALIKDHFGLGHKNLHGHYDVVSFDFAKIGLLNLVDNYLPESNVEGHFIFRGGAASEAPLEIRANCMVYYPIFHRVMTNIVKNISEAKSRSAEFIFDYKEDGLHITVKNKITQLNDLERSNLHSDLGKIILLAQNDKTTGHGLESINTLVDSIGGDFSFKIENGLWINEIFLPRPSNEQLKKSA
ncbi:putative membrane protein [Bacteriovorax sp. BSW11_IV]|uniref:GHKL domain-containing protein n=1 Tax=Bacteriovorax sp. BSW11_IV TaxID=1353529 RepID=UPI00038A3C93|nr:GHKL domain-containing protein [Bacteriovorax sp. BSW11_IV]EQC49394.1 putative membrane protein [Bacteriovorax sp. BSW11_IV]